jgi:hypothetical protein
MPCEKTAAAEETPPTRALEAVKLSSFVIGNRDENFNGRRVFPLAPWCGTLRSSVASRRAGWYVQTAGPFHLAGFTKQTRLSSGQLLIVQPLAFANAAAVRRAP